MVTAAKAKEHIFTSLADTLVYAKSQQNEWSCFNIISIMSIIVSMVTGIVIIWLVRKTHSGCSYTSIS